MCDLVLDAAEAELALRLQAQAADRQQDPHASVPVPVWLQLMNLFSNDAPMLVRDSLVQGWDQGRESKL